MYVERAAATMARYRAAAAEVSDTTAVTVPELFAAWDAGGASYAVGDRVRYGELLYRCLTAHTSQESWTPDAAPSLWVRIDDPAVEWPEWRQPSGSTDAYPKASTGSATSTTTFGNRVCPVGRRLRNNAKMPPFGGTGERRFDHGFQ